MRNKASMVDALLNPTNIVIAGASDKEGSYGYRIRRNLTKTKYDRRIYPVNPGRASVWGEPCFADVSSLPERPDQLVVTVPTEQTIDVIESAARAGARTAVVVQGGFGEGDTKESSLRGERLAEIIRQYEIGICGPNCMGYLSIPSRTAVTGWSLPALAFQEDSVGTVAVVSQSGSGGLAIYRKLLEQGVAARHVVSSGNEIGLTIEDWVEYFIADPGVGAVAAYVETCKDFGRFLDLGASAAGKGTPLVVYKVGESTDAREAARSHTGRLAGSRKVFADLAAMAGIIPVDSFDDMVDVLSVFRPVKRIGGRGIAGAMRSGGLRNYMLDSAARSNMTFPVLRQETKAALQRKGVAQPSTEINPIDTEAAGTRNPNLLLEITRDLAEDPSVDAVLLPYERVLQGKPPEGTDILTELGKISTATDGLIVLSATGLVSDPLDERSALELGKHIGVSYCPSADRAIRSLARLADWHETASSVRRTSVLSTPGSGNPTGDDASPYEGRIAETFGSGIPLSVHGRTPPLTEGSVDENEAKRFLMGYGLSCPAKAPVPATGVTQILNEVGLPGIFKAVSPGVVHKATAGLMSEIVASPKQAEDAWKSLTRRLDERDLAAEIWFEEAVLGGLECAVGLVRDPEFGLVVMFGSGGVLLEEHNDVAFSRPFTGRGPALQLISRTRVGRHLLSEEAKRSGRYSLTALVHVLTTIGSIAVSRGQDLDYLDINPLAVLDAPRGAVVLDASIRFRHQSTPG